MPGRAELTPLKIPYSQEGSSGIGWMENKKLPLDISPEKVTDFIYSSFSELPKDHNQPFETALETTINDYTKQVIARKYRPAKFADITAQEHVTRTIQNSQTSLCPARYGEA